jgi:hypothetical protein
VVCNLQGSCGLLTESLNLRIIDPKALYVFHQPTVLFRNLRETIRQLTFLRRGLAK